LEGGGLVSDYPIKVNEASLEQYSFNRSYSTSKDDLLNDFYIPALENSLTYDRAAGFFSSGLVALAPLAFSHFIQGGGRIRLICSPNFSATDIAAIRSDVDLSKISREQVLQDLALLTDGKDESRILATLLSSLIASEILDLRIAIPTSSRGLFHDKVGVFTDSTRKVSFVGSANETMAAWSGFDNHEQIEVFTSWHNEDTLARTTEHQKLFDELWAGVRRGWKIMDPRDGKGLLNRIVKPINVDIALDQVRERIPRTKSSKNNLQPRSLMPHQVAVIEDWERHSRRGIISFATGGGKTLAGIEGIRRWTSDGKSALVLVPSAILHKQWIKELEIELPDRQIVLLGDGKSLRGRESVIRTALVKHENELGKIVLSTYAMACKDEFLDLISNQNATLICADEVHNIGANETQNIMRRIQFGGRIGLSATPARKGSADETSFIQEYFGETLKPLFTIKDAIAAKRLVPYNYFFRTVTLLPEEEEDWMELTQRIKKAVAMNKGKFPTDKKEAAIFANLLIKRAAIIKGASQKTELAKEVLREKFVEGDRWLVYCQDQFQMGRVKKELIGAKYPILDYHQAMEGSASRTLEYFTREGGVMLAIKCLDEGVDIPEINRALILASSTNPREYIQRRGRVLRARDNKYSADIYDVLVLDTNGMLLSSGEAERAIEFAEEAQNSATKIELKILLDKANEVDYVLDTAQDEQVGE
jgi:superfamily II DNA or RNA helicase